MKKMALAVLLVALAACSSLQVPPAEQHRRCVEGDSGDVHAQVCTCIETEDGLECPAPVVLQGAE